MSREATDRFKDGLDLIFYFFVDCFDIDYKRQISQ
jgi:hypothetical protein